MHSFCQFVDTTHNFGLVLYKLVKKVVISIDCWNWHDGRIRLRLLAPFGEATNQLNSNVKSEV